MDRLAWLRDVDGEPTRRAVTDEWPCGCYHVEVTLLESNELIYKRTNFCDGHDRQYSYERRMDAGGRR